MSSDGRGGPGNPGGPQTGSDSTPDPARIRGRSRPGGHPARRRRAQSGRWRHTFAALDLGTNNCRLLVAKPTHEGFRVIDAFSRTVRLGEGVEESGRLSEEAMDRAVDGLKICADKMRIRRVSRSRSIATEACRLADNGLDFADRVARETGLKLDIIPTDEEALLAVTGCASLLDRSFEGALIFDIGGGSTELVWLDLSKLGANENLDRKSPSLVAWTSLPFGVVNLAERYGGGHPDERAYRAMVEEVMELLDGFDEPEPLRAAFEGCRVQMLGTSGTVTTLAGVHLGLPRYDRNQVDGTWIDLESVQAIANRLVAMSYDQRAAEPCIGPDRADLVVAGCAILEAINRLWPCQTLRVADRGLREGMLLDLMDQADNERAGNGRRPPRRRSPRRLS